VCTLTELTAEKAAELLTRCNGEVKTAIVSHRLGLSPDEARASLHAARGHLRGALEAGYLANGKV
jgi:N-acetylmuramic acid 6-phosphate (MurNAc-6-P) etherase